jgi:hypothetical protein
MFAVTKPYPKEFRDDVVRVARNREPGVELAQIAGACQMVCVRGGAPY